MLGKVSARLRRNVPECPGMSRNVPRTHAGANEATARPRGSKTNARKMSEYARFRPSVSTASASKCGAGQRCGGGNLSSSLEDRTFCWHYYRQPSAAQFLPPGPLKFARLAVRHTTANERRTDSALVHC